MISMKKKFLFPAFGLFALAVVACGGGGGGSSPGGGSSVVPTTQKVAVKLVLHVPTKVGQMTPKLRARMNQAQSTQGLDVAVYPNPNTTTAPLALQNYDISSGSPLCNINPTDQSRTCNLSINLDPGSYVFNLASYDQAPVGGIQSSGTLIGVGSTAVTVTAEQANAVNVSINGIAATAAVTLPVPVVKPLIPLTQDAIVSVLDADGDVIVSPSYVDGAGNPVTVTMSVTPASLVTLGAASFNAPLPSGLPVIYNPATITATLMGQSNSWNIRATLSNNAASGTAILSASPALSSVALNAPSYGIANEGNNYVWVTEPSTSAIQKITPLSNAVAAPITIGAGTGLSGSTPGPRDIVYNPLTPGGALWMTFFNSNSLATISDTGTGLTGVFLSSNAQSIALDTSNNVWTVEAASGLVDWSPATSISVTPINPGGGTVNNISAGPGGDMFATYVAGGTAEVAAFKPAGEQSPAPFNLPVAAGGSSLIAYDGSNALYVVQPASNKIDVVTGAFGAQAAAAFPLAVSPNALVEGPDGTMWFDSSSPAQICSVTNVGVATCYPLPAGVTPGQMVVFFNQIWITDTANPTLYALNL